MNDKCRGCKGKKKNKNKLSNMPNFSRLLMVRFGQGRPGLVQLFAYLPITSCHQGSADSGKWPLVSQTVVEYSAVLAKKRSKPKVFPIQ